MRPEALLARRRNLARFIQENPITVVLQRPAVTATAAGGRQRGATTALPAQTFRFVRASAPEMRMLRTQEGEQAAARKLLVGSHTADVRAGDRVAIGDNWYLVDSVEEDRSWRTVAALTEHGDPTP